MSGSFIPNFIPVPDMQTPEYAILVFSELMKIQPFLQALPICSNLLNQELTRFPGLCYNQGFGISPYYMANGMNFFPQPQFVGPSGLFVPPGFDELNAISGPPEVNGPPEISPPGINGPSEIGSPPEISPPEINGPSEVVAPPEISPSGINGPSEVVGPPQISPPEIDGPSEVGGPSQISPPGINGPTEVGGPSQVGGPLAINEPSGLNGLPEMNGSSINNVKMTLRLYIPENAVDPNNTIYDRVLGSECQNARMIETTTSCRVFIKGRGSIKGLNVLMEDWLRNRPKFLHLNEPQHFSIEADLPANIIVFKLKEAQAIVEDLATPLQFQRTVLADGCDTWS